MAARSPDSTIFSRSRTLSFHQRCRLIRGLLLGYALIPQQPCCSRGPLNPSHPTYPTLADPPGFPHSIQTALIAPENAQFHHTPA